MILSQEKYGKFFRNVANFNSVFGTTLTDKSVCMTNSKQNNFGECLLFSVQHVLSFHFLS
jgi:hypothetical protein